MYKLLVLALVAVAAVSAAGEPKDHCVEGVVQWPLAEDCRSYVTCPEGKVERCFPLFRRFNRETLKCDWFWRVDCSKVPQVPTPKPATA